MAARKEGPESGLLGTVFLSPQSTVLKTTRAGFPPLPSSCSPTLPPVLLGKGHGGKHPLLEVNETFLGSFFILFFFQFLPESDLVLYACIFISGFIIKTSDP